VSPRFFDDAGQPTEAYKEFRRCAGLPEKEDDPAEQR
jgi:hypothetical protein